MTDTRSDNKTLKSHITGMLAFAVLSMCIADGAAAQQRALGWVGQMFPTGGSTNSLAAGAPFTVYVQVWKPGVTDSPGAGADIGCTLLWGTVTAFGGAWSDITETAMSYNVDIGNNDEYAASISPAEGLYEFTAFCTDATDAATLYQDAGNGMLSVLPAATPLNTRALWIDEDTIAWDTSHGPAGVSFELHHDAGGDLSVPMTAGSGVALSFDRILDGASFAKFPNANGYQSLDLDPAALALIPDILRAEIALAVYDDQGNLLESTGVQIQGVLDALYAYDGSLGVEWDGGIPTLRVWAPTAKSVTLHRFADAGSGTAAATAAMSLDAATGVWSIGGDAGWDRQYYLYEVEVFVPETGNVENNLVTDPYSVSLSMNGARSQILDLADPALAPPGWDTLAKPAFAAPEDMTIYELHVRDFSAGDETVAEADRGTFRAFGYDGASAPLSDGMAHLAALADAGLTHLHILPAFDIASVNEFALIRVDPDPALLSTYASDSDLQQSSVGQFRIIDSFNWGYDPVHYGAPEGSYSSDPDDGAVRVLEFREMVASLAGSGLRIVMDVVYNHTSSFGQNSQSVLDKIVPNYYHRYDANGFIMRSSCCNDTATEFAMMQKLMLDTLLRWASAYKVDAFRFDLMNLHTPANMAAVRAALQSLTPADDGVDGNDIFVYGEGWDFGSLRDKGFVHAAQFNMAGSGVGTFNDRIRDAVHGGFDTDSLAIRTQGFVNGQSFDWNGHLYDKRFQGDLRFSMDRIRVGLSGNLQSFEFIDQSGNPQSGLGLSGTGYALDPQEAIQYISKHDNETLYDLNVFKAPLGASGTAVTSMADRVRIQNLGLSIVGLSQGVPFFHAGSDLLRSKSLDRNSFDSGDWFNTLDFALQSNNFGVGLPPAWDNESRWPIMAPLLTDPTLLPAPADIARSAAHFQEILAIRRSAKLFRLETAEDVMTRMRVHNTGPQQTDGLIVLSLSDEIEPDVDPLHEYLVVLFNADKSAHSFTIPELAGRPFVLHPVQAASDDPLVRTANVDTSSATFDVPARTTAVFVVASAADTDGDGLVDTGDNCIEEPNPDQRDTDGDGIGNACDPDLPPNNDCAINFLDLAVLKAAMFSTPGSPNWNPDADLDGDGSVNFVDLGQMKSRFFLVPGPAAPPNLCADRD